MNAIYFQPPGINPKYCEVGMIHESDSEYIWYLDEPCKILIREVKIIDEKDVVFDKKNRLCKVKSSRLKGAFLLNPGAVFV